MSPVESESLYLHEPRYAEGVCFNNSILPFSEKTLRKSRKFSAKTPLMPLTQPYTQSTFLLFMAACITPASVALIAAVGPPDCPTSKFFFVVIPPIY